MPPVVSIIFDSTSAIFFSGQTITGRVEVNCYKTFTSRAITVTFHGHAGVEWSEQTGGTSGEEETGETTVTYISSESYYKKEYRVWGDGNSKSDLPSGQHIFNFAFLLPFNIPSSLETSYGYVRHQCKVKLDRPWKKDVKVSRPYSVVDLYDLNLEPRAQLPILLQDSKTICCLCCASGPISLIVNIDKSGYVSGENIVINAECCNKSSRDITRTKVSIWNTIKHHAEGKTKDSSNELCEVTHGEIAAGQTHTWSAECLTIPTVPPSSLRGCSIIDVLYELKFEVVPSGLSSNLVVKSPIIIGSIPLRQAFGYFVPSQVTQQRVPPVQYTGTKKLGAGVGAPSAPPSYDQFPGLQQYPDLPPPSYASCMFGKKNAKGHEEDELDDNKYHKVWSPQYISYKVHSE